MLLKHNIVIFLLAGVFLSACSAGHIGDLSVPTTTLTAPPLTATATSLPTATPTPTPRPSTDTPVPPMQNTPIIIEQPTSIVPTELAADMLDQRFPIALLNIYHPGPNSRLSSPIKISAYAFPGDQGKVTLQLWGEDGRLMAEQLIQLGNASGGVSFTSQIPFEINSAGESTLLTLTSYDSYGRKIAIASVPLILMQIGDSEIEQPGFGKEPFVVSSLPAGTAVSGGTLHIKGVAHPFSTSPLIIELIKTNGGVVASKQVSLAAIPSGEDYASFAVDIPYNVTQNTPIRLSLRQSMDHAPFLDMALSSELIILQP
jgi:hypothetical protein